MGVWVVWVVWVVAAGEDGEEGQEEGDNERQKSSSRVMAAQMNNTSARTVPEISYSHHLLGPYVHTVVVAAAADHDDAHTHAFDVSGAYGAYDVGTP